MKREREHKHILTLTFDFSKHLNWNEQSQNERRQKRDTVNDIGTVIRQHRRLVAIIKSSVNEQQQQNYNQITPFPKLVAVKRYIE